MKTVKLLIAIFSLLIILLVRYVFSETLSSFHNINVWGVYLFCVPIVYCLMSLFSDQDRATLLKGIMYTTIGVILTILLSTDIANSFWLEKVVVTLIGAGASWAYCKNT
ncbi:hypothetical protein D0T85_05400 [Bacteroides sp. 519]|nr:hypothetical protein [Bacteroides sp. 519]